MNSFKTFLLMLILTLILVFVGNLLGGPGGALIAFIVAAVMNIFSYMFSDKLALASYRAQEVTEAEQPELHRIVEHLAQSAGIPKPRVYLIPSDSPNAFATGRNPQHAAVAVTRGILKLMNRDEIAGVIAHELAHVKNRDILLGSIVSTIAGAIMMLRYAGFFLGGDGERRGGGNILVWLIAPIAATILQLAISRTREYGADAEGARIAGTPYGLANALKKLGTYTQRIPMATSPQSAHMFIANPLSLEGLARIFSTHPPMEERIRRLEGSVHTSIIK